MYEKLCPRAKYNGKNVATRFLVSKDPAIMAIARMVVAGIDHKYSIHPHYRDFIKDYGRERAQTLIRECVEIPGACDVIQTDILYGGLGLFGGLAENEKEFIFYDWSCPSPKFRVHMTPEQARDIVYGKQKFVKFIPCTKAHFATRNRAKKKLENTQAQCIRKLIR